MRKLVIVMLAVVMLLEPALVSAQAVDQSLQNFFNTFGGVVTGTPPGVYQSQSRGYLSGGALSVRAPMQARQLVSIQPPRFSFGCNGFDATFGGLSYISLDRFLQLLQQIGTGAVMGFAYQLAMAYLSPSIKNVLSEMEAAARFINTQLNVSPCQVSTALSQAMAASAKQGSFDPLIAMGEQRWKAWTGMIQDVVADMQSQANRTTADSAAAMNGTEWDIKGNIVWDALYNGMSNVSYDERRLIMSLVGTVIVPDNGQPTWKEPTLELRDLLDAQPGVAYAVYDCQDPCLDPTSVQETNVTGFRPRVKTVLQQIIDAIEQNQPITPAQASWLDVSPVPLYLVFRQHRADAVMLNTLADRAAGLVAVAVLQQYLSNLLQDLNTAIGQYNSRKPQWNGGELVKNIIERIAALRFEAFDLGRKEAQKLHAEAAVTTELVKQADWAYRKR